ncbi:DUF481 domain-containing protein [Desulfobacterales bacterium HSG16]|nr:DUF481 domain-containing protein [Desulfobacterales bacterium HSG16]
MKKLSSYVVLSLMFTMFFVPVSFGGDEKQPGQQSLAIENDSWIASGEAVQGKWWWAKNAKKFTPLPDPLLYRFEASYSFSEMSGNVDATMHRGSAELALRKQLLTSITAFQLSKSDTDIALMNASTSVESQSLNHKFRYALTDWMEVTAGTIWTMNDSAKYLKNRVGYFGGALFGLIDRPDLIVNMGAFYGYTDTEYMNDKITGKPMYRDFKPVEDYSSDDVYFSQMLRWKITDTVTFTENAMYAMFLKDTEYYHWTVNLALNCKLTKHISFVTSYALNYDNNSFIDAVQKYLDARKAAGLKAGELEKMDTVLAFGLKFSF